MPLPKAQATMCRFQCAGDRLWEWEELVMIDLITGYWFVDDTSEEEQSDEDEEEEEQSDEDEEESESDEGSSCPL